MTNKEAIAILENYYNGYFGYKIDDVQEAHKLAIKALERQHGEWIKENDTGLIGCSCCHIVWLRGCTKFCPNCGADMRGDNT